MLKFIKLGRIYTIEPKLIKYKSYKEVYKQRPGLIIDLINENKSLIIQIGSQEYFDPFNLNATKLVEEQLKKLKCPASKLHMDVSGIEKNEIIIKPYLYKNKEYIDVPFKIIKRLQKLYRARINSLEKYRIKRIKIAIINDNKNNCNHQIELLRKIMPKKYKKSNDKIINQIKLGKLI